MNIAEVAQRDIGSRPTQALEDVTTHLEPGELVDAIAESGGGLTAVTNRRVIRYIQQGPKFVDYPLTTLHGCLVLDDIDDPMLALLVDDAPFDVVSMDQRNATRIVASVGDARQRAGLPVHQAFGARFSPALVLVGSNALNVETGALAVLTVVSTGVQIRPFRTAAGKTSNPERIFIPARNILSIKVEGADQVQHRPSVAGTVFFGVVGLAMRSKEKHAYVAVGTTDGDLVIEIEGKLPTEVRGAIRGAARAIEGPAAGHVTEEQGSELAPQLDRIVGLLEQILAQLRLRSPGDVS